MSGKDGKVWVGADPGGNNKFGVAVLLPDEPARTRCVSSADEAVDAVCKWLEETSPAGVGVDAPLWWSSGGSGARFVDQWLRDTYGLSGGQVQEPNSLKGAALVQGAMFVLRIRERFPGLGVTETHPKALLATLGQEAEGAFFREYGVRGTPVQTTEDERDALISAVAAREGFGGHWPCDLSERRYPTEQDPSESWLGPVNYYWPPQEP
jgi:predicted nuclease with RNAse H fold